MRYFLRDMIIIVCVCVCVCVCVQVMIDQTGSHWDYTHVYLGVVTESPDTITLPDWSYHLKSAVVVRHDWVRVNGTQVRVEHTHTHTHIEKKWNIFLTNKLIV